MNIFPHLKLSLHYFLMEKLCFFFFLLQRQTCYIVELYKAACLLLGCLFEVFYYYYLRLSARKSIRNIYNHGLCGFFSFKQKVVFINQQSNVFLYLNTNSGWFIFANKLFSHVLQPLISPSKVNILHRQNKQDPNTMRLECLDAGLASLGCGR